MKKRNNMLRPSEGALIVRPKRNNVLRPSEGALIVRPERINVLKPIHNSSHHNKTY